MLRLFLPLAALFAGAAIYLAGHGLLTTLVPVRLTMLNASVEAVGLVGAGYYFGLMIGARWCPVFIRRVGHVRSFAGFAAVLAALSLALPLAPDPWAWLALRIATGVAIAAINLVIESWLTTAAPADWRGRVLATYMVVYYAAFGGGQFLLHAWPVEGFQLFSLGALLIALAIVPVVLTRVEAPTLGEQAPMTLAALARLSPLAFATAIATGLLLGAFYGLAPVWLIDEGIEPAETGVYIAAAVFGGLALQWPIGLLSDRVDRRIVIVGTAAAAGVLAAAIAVVGGDDPMVLAVLLAGLGGAMFTLWPVAVAHAADFLRGAGAMVGLSAGILMVYSIAAVAGPIVAGFAQSELGGGTLFWFMAGVALLLAAFGAWRSTRRPTPPAEERVPYVALPRTTPTVGELDPRADDPAAS
ncbi:MAG: MFS transporter [Alphaproteobacteria bacterium]